MNPFKKLISFFIIFSVLCSMNGCGQQEKKEEVLLNIDGMTDLQKAVVITAESFYLRGNYAQYDMGNLYDKEIGGSMERRITGLKAPEDYTAQNMGYTDCSGFVYDVYRTALNITIMAGTPWTKTYCESTPKTVLKEQPIEWGAATNRDQKLKEFTDMLQPGDIMVYRYRGGTSGHAMLYVGNGMMIHSNGSSFSFRENAEK